MKRLIYASLIFALLGLIIVGSSNAYTITLEQLNISNRASMSVSIGDPPQDLSVNSNSVPTASIDLYGTPYWAYGMVQQTYTPSSISMSLESYASDMLEGLTGFTQTEGLYQLKVVSDYGRSGSVDIVFDSLFVKSWRAPSIYAYFSGPGFYHQYDESAMGEVIPSPEYFETIVSLSLDQPYMIEASLFSVMSDSLQSNTSTLSIVSLNPECAPVPEPSTLLLLGSGLVGLIGFKRKLRKN